MTLFYRKLIQEVISFAERLPYLNENIFYS
jgi:hypothetical protein